MDTTAKAIRGRRLARLIVFASFALVAAAFAIVLAPPATMGTSDPGPWGFLGISLGLLGAAVGLVLMVRIDLAARDPERHASSSRAVSRR